MLQASQLEKHIMHEFQENLQMQLIHVQVHTTLGASRLTKLQQFLCN
jgi:hypothetical protein